MVRRTDIVHFVFVLVVTVVFIRRVSVTGNIEQGKGTLRTGITIVSPLPFNSDHQKSLFSPSPSWSQLVENPGTKTSRKSDDTYPLPL